MPTTEHKHEWTRKCASLWGSKCTVLAEAKGICILRCHLHSCIKYYVYSQRKFNSGVPSKLVGGWVRDAYQPETAMRTYMNALASWGQT